MTQALHSIDCDVLVVGGGINGAGIARDAAYLAGLAVGFWCSLDEIASQWRVARRFEPAMATGERLERLDTWRRAVDRSRDWSD